MPHLSFLNATRQNLLIQLNQLINQEDFIMIKLCDHSTFSCAMVIRCRALADIQSKFCRLSTNLLALFVHALCVECTLSSFKIVIGIIPFTFPLTDVLLYCCDRSHNWVSSIFCNLHQRTWLGTRFYHLICRRNEPAMTF